MFVDFSSNHFSELRAQIFIRLDYKSMIQNLLQLMRVHIVSITMTHYNYYSRYGNQPDYYSVSIVSSENSSHAFFANTLGGANCEYHNILLIAFLFILLFPSYGFFSRY